MCGGIQPLLLLVPLLASLPQTGEAAAAPRGAIQAETAGKQEPDARETLKSTEEPDSPAADGLKMLGRMLEQNWQPRPEWADMATGILHGRAMGTGNGWFHPARKRHDWAWVRENLDADGDGRVAVNELLQRVPELEEWFERLDRDLNGALTEEDFDWTGRLARAGDNDASTTTNLLFERADADSNGRITRDEILEFFANVDRDGAGFWTPEDLYAAFAAPEPSAPRAPENRAVYVEKMLDLLFSGQLGWFEPGPDVGEAAPDFTLPTHDGASSVTLSEAFEKKPTVLVFGSFT